MREKIKKLTPHFLIRFYQAARYWGITVLFFLLRLFPIKKNLVVLCNVWGYGDNAKYVAEELVRRKRAAGKADNEGAGRGKPDGGQQAARNADGRKNDGMPYGRKGSAKSGSPALPELVFVTNYPGQVPACPEIRAVKTNSLPAILALSRARVWVDNNRKEAYIKKRKGQYYIQLWHGGIALKRIEGDCERELGKAYIRRAKKDSKATDLLISNSDFCTAMYRRAFWAECEIAEYGSPRNDRFLQRKNMETERKLQEHTAVYAPTYRSHNACYYDFDTEKLREALQFRFGGSWTIMVRLHPLVAASHQFSGLPGATDVSSAPDLYELLYSADVLITDYSNTMFEFAMTGRPVFLYANDVQEYQRERGMYFDYETLPFPKAETTEAFYEEIRRYRAEEYQEAQAAFFKQAGLKESGRAAELTADRIEQVLAICF